jgi:hypothetical protein
LWPFGSARNRERNREGPAPEQGITGAITGKAPAPSFFMIDDEKEPANLDCGVAGMMAVTAAQLNHTVKLKDML